MVVICACLRGGEQGSEYWVLKEVGGGARGRGKSMIRFENKRTTRQGTTRKERSHTKAALLQSALVIVAEPLSSHTVHIGCTAPLRSAPRRTPDVHVRVHQSLILRSDGNRTFSPSPSAFRARVDDHFPTAMLHAYAESQRRPSADGLQPAQTPRYTTPI